MTAPDLAALYREHGSLRAVARLTGVSERQVKKAARAAGITFGAADQKPRQFTVEEVNAAYDKHGSLTGAARALGCNKDTIRKYLSEDRSHRTKWTALTREGYWRDDAACLDTDPDLFFPLGFGAKSVAQAQEAKKVCSRCPVVDDCLEWSLRTSQEYGVWGGLDEAERRRMLAARLGVAS